MTIENRIDEIENRNRVSANQNAMPESSDRVGEIEIQLLKLTETVTALAGSIEAIAARLNEQTQMFAIAIQTGMAASAESLDSVAAELSNIYAGLENAPLVERPDYEAYREWKIQQQTSAEGKPEEELF